MRASIWEARRQRLAECAYLGMTKFEAAQETGFTILTVEKYAAKFGIVFSKTSSKKSEFVSSVENLAAQGMTRQEAAASLGVDAHLVGRTAREHEIEFIHASTKSVDQQRAEAMAAMYRAGKTLEDIGQVYGITRERVRQIIAKEHSISAEDGGQAVRAKLDRNRKRAASEAECYSKHGCSRQQLKDLRTLGRTMVLDGACRERTPIGAFSRQRCNAKKRGIAWTLTLWDWWTIWQESGHWDERGRTGGSYVMCRFADNGAYEIGNVYVATQRHNLTVQPNNRYRKSHPDFETAMAEKLARQGTRLRYTKQCTADGCDKPHYAHGWCNNHYYHFVTKPARAAKGEAA